MTYRDLSEKRFAGSQYNLERDYWLNKLSGELVKTGFPSDAVLGMTGTAASPKQKIETLNFKIPHELFVRLMDIINNSDSRLHTVLVTGLFLLLYKYTGNLDIIIGTPIDKQDVEGEYINTFLPLRNRIDEQISVKEFLLQVKQTVIEAINNQNYPIETIPHELGMAVSESDEAFPLFDTAILLQNIQDKQYLEHLNLNMLFSFLRTDESLNGIVEYNTSVFESKTVERIVNHFLRLLHEAFFHVNSKLVDVPVLTEEERMAIVVDFNNTGADYPRDKMIHQLFEEQVIRTPNNTAVQIVSKQLTYQEINNEANQLSRLLREKGIGNEIVAAIMLESSIEVPLAILAVLKAGGAYLPMGFEYPEERIDYILKNSQAKVLLTRRFLVEGKNITCPIHFLDDEVIYSGDNENLEPVNNVDSLVYTIYTSGTTGQPKGVMIEHRGLVNYIWWASRTYVNGEKLDFPLYTSISFDLTVTSIFTPLITGNTIIVYGGVDRKLYIEEVIDDNRVGVVKLTPSHLKLLRSKIVKNSSIKRFIVGGEELETSLARDIYNNFSSKVEIYNEYGPTETVVGSMIYKYEPACDTRYTVPIGRPVANTQVYILNNHYQVVPIGVVGELYIGGNGLARGYLYNPGLTAEKFVANPFVTGQQIYKTGDLAVRLADGNIEYKGRIDHQVKIRGYRVETGEIEAKIVDFQKMSRAGREQKENIVEKLDLKSLQYCNTCLIPANYPGGIQFDEQGICEICREFETYKDKALAYFKTIPDFHKVVAHAQKTKKSKYDCLLLYSGGKDSSYTLHRLVEMGLKVLAFTFDNGYISEKAFENIDRTIKLLKIDHITLDSQAMKEIFVESLWSDYNVCNGCFKAVNTLGTKIAHDHQINLVISGLTRGQIFDIKLHGLFKLGIFEEETIEERLNLFRKNYHSMTHRTSRLIGVEISDETLDNTYFVDYFRYDNISTNEIFEYLKEKDQGWVRPTDTGASSSNCIINDVGIYVHLKDKGCHFYAPQLSWDCRLGTISREEGLEEMWGYKVDYPMTHRVLNEIGYYNAFTGAVVTDVKDDRGEKVLCAYILADKELELSELKSYLSRELPDYMIPTFFTRIDRIPLTPSGKIDRSTLPKPELTFKEEYVAPRNSVEEKLVNVWSELLGIRKEKISIDVNFFEVGGHSLRATFLAASINKEFNVKVPLVKIFEAPTIRGLAQYVVEEAEENIFISINPAKVKEYYALSSAQTRLYILQQMELGATAYNVPNMFDLYGNLEKERFEKAFQKLITRHENLRTSFEMIEDTFVQKVYHPSEIHFKIQYDELETGGEGEKDLEKTVDKKVKDFVQPFDLSQVPLLRVKLLRIEPLRHLLMVDVHHILIDGVSYHIFVKDFLTFYRGQELPPLPIQYKDYSEWQQSKAGQEAFKRQEEYWLRQFQGEIPELNLPTDYPRPTVQSFEGANVSFVVEKEETASLRALALSQESTLFMVLLAAYTILLYKLSDQEDIIVGVPIAGRIHADLANVIGIFINMLAIRNFPEGELTFTAFLRNLKIKSLEAFENQEYSLEDLVDKVSVERDISRNPLFDVLFVLQNMFSSQSTEEISPQEKNELMAKPYNYENRTSKYDLSLYSWERGEILSFIFEFCTKLFNEESILRFIDYFKKIITTVVKNPETKISEINILPEEEKRRLLYDFNNTATDYPKDKVIHELISEQVQKTPGRLAVVFEDKSLSYEELGKQADRLAAYLCFEKDIQIGERVGILMDRSMNIIIAQAGILKAGGTYVPIDSSYPEARIKYIIDDAEIGVVISEKVHIKVLNRLQWECPGFHTFLCMDSISVREETEVEVNPLMDEKMWHYVGDDAENEIAGGGWMTSYTGASFTKEEMKEYSDNIFNKLLPFLQPQTRVLEIGCASGITMYQIAPHVGFYHGTDLSQVIIDKNRRKVDDEGWRNINLSCLPAHEINKIPEKNFDIIIINSVVHYFHGHNYFRNILRQAVEKMADKGYLFLGDLMDQDLKDSLIREMKDFKKANSDKNYRTKTDWNAELFISRDFLQDIALEIPGIQNVECSNKIYTLENELTKFRYDAIITIDKSNKKANETRKPRKYQHDLNALNVFQKTNLQKNRKVCPHTLGYVTYTSGTTGFPKGIMIEHRSVINLIKGITDIIDFNENDSILSLTSISFDIFVLESLIPLSWGSKVVMGNGNEQLDNSALTDAIYRHKISIFQATPSRLKILFSDNVSKESLRSLRHLVVGGEVFPETLLKKARNLIIGKIYNGYGPTENTVYTTIKDVSDENALNIGRPLANVKIYILSRDKKLLPIGVPGELCIGGDGLAMGYLNNEKLTKETFSDDPFSPGQRLYKTGDLARWLPDGDVDYLGRFDHQVKIRGFRIELGEIEKRLSEIEGVVESVVIERIEKSGEKYLCAYIVADKKIVISDTRNILADTLPDYMIPSYFIRVDKLPLTPGGKIDRKALPDPTIKAGDDHIAPRDKVEERLTELWSEGLNIEKSVIGIDSNFFELGGHSLKATILITKINKEFHVKFPLPEVFKKPNIRGMAEYIRKAAEEKSVSLEALEKKEYYRASSQQKRLFILQQRHLDSIVYNRPNAYISEIALDKDKLEVTFRKLIQRHESLRTSFDMIGGELVQRIHEDVPFAIAYYDNDVTGESIGSFIQPFDLYLAPLLRVKIAKTGDQKNILLVDIHHIISDGVSDFLLVSDFMELYQGKQLQALELQYKDYSYWQTRLFESGEMKKQESYWLENFTGEIPNLAIPRDYKNSLEQDFEGSKIYLEFNHKETKQLNELVKKEGATLFMLLLAGYNVLLAKLSGQEDIIVGTGIAGRRHVDFQKIIGMFVNTLALRNYPIGEKSFKDFLQEVKERTLLAFENQEYLFEDLVGKVVTKRDHSWNPLFDTSFVMQNMERNIGNVENIEHSELMLRPYSIDKKKSIFDIAIFCEEIGGILKFNITYRTALFKKETIEEYFGYYKDILSFLINNDDLNFQLKDIQLASGLESFEAKLIKNETGDFGF